LLLAGRLPAQTQIDMNQLRNLDLTKAGTVLFRSSSSLPATCSPGEGLILTGGPGGGSLYLCIANAWALQADTRTFSTVPAAGATPVADGNGRLALSWLDLSPYQVALGFTPLNPASNLSDLASAPAARTNLGLGAAALKSVQGTGTSLAAFAGGITIPSDCLMFDAHGNVADAGVPCGSGGGGSANYSQSFSSQTSVVLNHNANSTAVLIQCFDSSNNLLIPNSITLSSATSATVAFSTAQSGKCVVNASGGGGGASDFSQITGVASLAQGGTGQSAKGPAFDALAPATTKGDTIVYNGSTNTRLGVGSDGSCWIADSTQATGVRWGPCSSTTAGAGVTLMSNILSVDATTVPTFLTGAGSLSFGTLANGACGSGTFSLIGAASGDTVAAGWPSTLESGLIGMVRVSAPNLIEVRLCNLSGAPITVADGETFAATIVRSF
jgi:hypothetical protein